MFNRNPYYNMNPYYNANVIVNNLSNSNPMNFIQQFQNFKRNFQGNPQQVVMNMLNNGQMSQQQFNQLQAMANQIMGSMNNNG